MTQSSAANNAVQNYVCPTCGAQPGVRCAGHYRLTHGARLFLAGALKLRKVK